MTSSSSKGLTPTGVIKNPLKVIDIAGDEGYWERIGGYIGVDTEDLIEHVAQQGP